VESFVTFRARRGATMERVTERKPPGMSFRTWVESQISRSMARGEFENLPGAGKPLHIPSRDDSMVEWVVAKARQENIDLFCMLPPGLALRKERDDLPRRAAELPSEDAVRALAEDYNARVQAFWRRPQESRWSPLPGLADVEALVEEWRDNRPAPVAAPAPVPEPRRRWLDRWRLTRRG
jgi:Domain of unknown function (DUF1992)